MIFSFSFADSGLIHMLNNKEIRCESPNSTGLIIAPDTDTYFYSKIPYIWGILTLFLSATYLFLSTDMIGRSFSNSVFITSHEYVIT